LQDLLQHIVFRISEHSETLSVLYAKQSYPVDLPGKVSLTYFDKGNYVEINIDILAGYT
jgi:hypothetical protein